MKRQAKCFLLMAVFFLVGLPTAFAQQLKVTGHVTDESGEAVIGATVLEKGTTNGTITDAKGDYVITAKSGATLVFSYIGYIPQEKEVTGNVLNIKMEASAKAIDEVIVVGYGVQKKSSVTGAISSIKASDMENRTITSPTQALQGKTAGVQAITSSSAPGSTPAIRVRGYSSNNDMSPLFVVDGIRLSSIAGIDPNDIESMEVLKDAASAAIYGAQAGNGVILITTKRGQKGESGHGQITYDYQLTNQRLGDMPTLLNASQYLQYESEKSSMTLANYTAYAKTLGWDGTTDTNWADVTFENSLMQKHNLALQGANNDGSYYLSLTYLTNNGIVVGDKDFYERLTATVNADYKIKPWLKVGTNNQVEKYETKSVAAGGTGYGNIIAGVLQLDPLTAATYTADNLTPEMKGALANGNTLLQDENGNYYGVSSFYPSEQYNPLVKINNTTGKTFGWNVTGSIYGDLKPMKDLTITSRLGYRLSSYYSPNYNHKFYGAATQSNTRISISSTTGMTTYYQWENFANYMKTINEVHEISAMAGMSFSKNIYQYDNAGLADSKGDAVAIDDVYGFGDIDNGLSTVDTKTVGGGESVSAQTSYFGRLGYTYDGKYMIQGSLRADAYDLSKLPLTNRWGYFPAVSAGWDITKESFMESTANWLSSLKLRASWGQNGSVAALSGYQYSTDMKTGDPVAFGTNTSYTIVNSAYPSTMGNDELSWETSEQLDYGIDARFLNDRLSLNVDYFDKKTKDLLVTGITASLVAGGTASPMNAGNVSNKGVELELGWKDNVGDLKYSIKGNIATLTNEVTYLHPSITRLTGTSVYNKTLTCFEKGKPVWYFYGYKFDYIDANGDAVYKDVNGDEAIDENDKTNIGDAIPDYTYGVTLNAAYKGFDLTVFGTGSQGNQIYQALARSDGQSTYNVVKSVWYDNRWIAGADNTKATVPSASSDVSNYICSDAMVFDGSFFKIKQIQLGYSLPKNLLKAISFSNCRLYCSLDDFFTFTKYPGMDPEVAASSGSGMGIDLGSYPASKKVVFGVNLSF